MQVRTFKRSHHAGFIHQWLVDRNLDPALSSELPSVGFMVFLEKDQGIAAGFIRRLENCAVGMMDSWITNPAALAEHRNQALDLLIESLIRKAKRLGLRKVLGATVEDRITIRCLKFGFQILPQSWLGLDLEQKHSGERG